MPPATAVFYTFAGTTVLLLLTALVLRRLRDHRASAGIPPVCPLVVPNVETLCEISVTDEWSNATDLPALRAHYQLQRQPSKGGNYFRGQADLKVDNLSRTSATCLSVQDVKAIVQTLSGVELSRGTYEKEDWEAEGHVRAEIVLAYEGNRFVEFFSDSENLTLWRVCIDSKIYVSRSDVITEAFFRLSGPLLGSPQADLVKHWRANQGSQ